MVDVNIDQAMHTMSEETNRIMEFYRDRIVPDSLLNTIDRINSDFWKFRQNFDETLRKQEKNQNQI